MSKIKNWVAITTLTALGTGVWITNGDTLALDASWGPERETFTWQVPATYPTFNSITDNPSLGDERNFVRVKEYGTENNYADYVDAVGGKIYEVYVYYHNNASANLNESGKGIADNVRLSMAIPQNLKAGDSAVIKGTIKSTNTNPSSVWDTAFLNAQEDLTLNYVANSAVIHNDGSANNSVLEGSVLLNDTGVQLAHWKEEWGMIPGCNEYAGYVTFQLQAVGENTPVTPGSSTPSEMPETGPAEVILASVIVLAIIAGGVYWYKTSKAVKKTTRKAMTIGRGGSRSARKVTMKKRK